MDETKTVIESLFKLHLNNSCDESNQAEGNRERAPHASAKVHHKRNNSEENSRRDSALQMYCMTAIQNLFPQHATSI